MKKELKKVTVALIAVFMLLPVLFSCGKRNTNFSTDTDLLKFLEGTWECVEDKTYISMRYEEKQYDEIVIPTVTIDKYSYPAKANWDNLFSNAYLGTIHYADLLNNNYYSNDNSISCLLSLNYDLKGVYSALFYNVDNCINIEEKTIDSSFKKYDEDLGVTIKITDEGNIEIIGGKNVKISGTYTFVSSDPDWFYKKTANLWKKAAKKEIDTRRDRFDSLKKYYVDLTAEYEQTNGNNSIAIDWIVDGFPYLFKSGLAVLYDTEDATVNNFYAALGYLSHFEKGSVGAELAEYGWNAVEQIVFYIDIDKSQEYFDSFKETFENELGINLRTE